jgi:hypothetical protein
MSDPSKPQLGDKDKLTGVNYLTWAYLMQMILIHADLWEIVNDPPDVPTAPQRKSSQKALALIVFNISSSLIPVVRICTTASEAWRKLEGLYAQRSENYVQTLRENLAALVLGSSESISDYFARARGIWNELVSLGHTTSETDVVWSILRGLPPRFNVIVTVLRSSIVPLTLDSTIGQLLTIDKSTTTPAETAMVASPSKPVCHYCKKPGHLIRDCKKRINAEARRGQAPPPPPAPVPAPVLASHHSPPHAGLARVLGVADYGY